MKAKFKIYGQDYEVEIKAKDIKNLNASPKATQTFCKWLEKRLWEASHEHVKETSGYNEITTAASNLHKVNKYYEKL